MTRRISTAAGEGGSGRGGGGGGKKRERKPPSSLPVHKAGPPAPQARKTPVTGEQSWDAKTLGRNHVETPVKYPMNPPVGGDHNPRWMNCDGDVYKNAIPEVNAVHSLEHGAVWVTYNEKAAKGDVDALAGKVAKTPYTLMSPDKEQAGAIMLSAWGKQLTVDKADDPRVAQFLTKYVQGPQTPEPGAACTNGLAEK
ncbi:DUF3105 domain-containing protein [Streptomyces sp. NPDC059389]|uniref:DUF3105 domain-containing protein n=1 Tax=Streptomyces sp. NPDC059389 TaxID=3346818 RepID=UPI00368C7E59